MHCAYCGKSFIKSKYSPRQKYCSQKCYQLDHPKTYVRKFCDIGVGKHGKNVVTEENSTYLEILRKQHNPSYKYIAKNYLNLSNGNRLTPDEAYGFSAAKIRI